MLVGYIRTSTSHQEQALQEDALNQVKCDRIFRDVGTGKNTDRVGLREALEFVRPGDTLVCWRMDRMFRSLTDMLTITTDLERRGVHLRSLSESFDTSTAAGKLMRNMLGCVSEFEANLLRERVMAGLQSARSRGRVGGRKEKLDETQVGMLRAAASNDAASIADLARSFKVSRQTVYRYLSK